MYRNQSTGAFGVTMLALAVFVIVLIVMLAQAGYVERLQDAFTLTRVR